MSDPTSDDFPICRWRWNRPKPQATPIVSERGLQRPRRNGLMRLATAISALLLLSSCIAAAPSRERCDTHILKQAAAEGLEIASISVRGVRGGREDDHFRGYRAELEAADGGGYGALTNRSCSHIRIWRY